MSTSTTYIFMLKLECQQAWLTRFLGNRTNKISFRARNFIGKWIKKIPSNTLKLNIVDIISFVKYGLNPAIPF